MTSEKRVTIVGQGYVGLPLAMAAVAVGYKVTGIDVSNVIVENLNQGKSHVEDVSDGVLQRALELGLYKSSTSGQFASESDICVICVPTPLDKSGLPDLTYVESAVRLVANNLPPQALLISESTSYPGTVREVIIPLIQSLRSDKASMMSFASAPERVDPRNDKWDMKNTPRLVAGIDQNSTNRAMKFYTSICDTVIEVSKLEVAEMAKLLENTFRQVNIALVNQLVPFCKEIGIDMREVVEAAGSKPYGYMKFFPGAGVGGHCIPIDPLYLLWKARQVGVELPFVANADEINGGMPSYVVSRLLESAKPSKGETFAILGVAYKAGISDVRESPAEQVAKELASQGYKVVWADPLVESFNKYEKFSGHQLKGAIVVTAQAGLPVVDLAASGVKILDCTGAFKGIQGVEQL
jgi:UDP-N-acetyl-D-glucosamine dehydrogenase